MTAAEITSIYLNAIMDGKEPPFKDVIFTPTYLIKEEDQLPEEVERLLEDGGIIQ